MSEEIKYEPVFGPQDLFDGAGNCDEYLVAVQHSVGQKTKVSFYQSLVEAFNYVTDFPPRGVVFHRAAMRRIIKIPVWTMADKQAGRLPDVGVKCVFCDEENLIPPENVIYPEPGTKVEIVGNTTTSDGLYPVAVFKWLHEDGVSQRYASSGYCSDFSPIETPAEKAQRLEDEWVEKAYDDLLANIGIHSTESPDFVKQNLRRVYSALLSGELKAPEVE